MQKSSIVYFLTRSLFLGFGITLLFSFSGKDCYWGAIVGLGIGLILTNIYQYLINKKGDRSISDLLKNKGLIGYLTKGVLLIVSFVILLYVLVLYKEFVGSFLLVNSPELYSLIPLIILALYLAFKGLKIISRVATCLIPFSIFLCLVSYFGLVSFFQVSNFLPIFTNSGSDFFKTVLTFVSVSFFPNLLTIHLKGKTNGYNKMYILAAIFVILTLICINGVFGEELVNIFRFPEYMVLKQLKLFKFIEKIENVIALAWIFDLFITCTMAMHSIKELVGTKHDKLITIVLVGIALLFLEIFFASNYINELIIYDILPYVASILIFITILCLAILVRKIKK